MRFDELVDMLKAEHHSEVRSAEREGDGVRLALEGLLEQIEEDFDVGNDERLSEAFIERYQAARRIVGGDQ